jgi:microcystin-dependent protein
MASQALSKAALWMQNVDYPASWDRSLIDSIYDDEGVITGFAVTPNGGLDIAIAAGTAVVEGDEVANQGKYLVDSDAVVTLTLGSVGTTRTEYVYLAINDSAVAGGRTGDNASIDTSTSPPPNSALLLATLNLPAGTSTIGSEMITDGRVFVSTTPPNSVFTNTIADGAVTTPKLADGAATSDKIGANAVTTAKIVDGAVLTSKIGDQQVTTEKIADGSITAAKLDSELTSGEANDPADAIIMIAGSTAPTGWALCDGAAYSRTTYAETFARISTTYGVGNGSTTFNVPDLRNRFPVGRGPATWSDALNEKGGSKDAVVVDHGHTDSGHQHGFEDEYRTASQLGTAVAAGSSYGYNPALMSSNSVTSPGSASLSNAGQSGTNANLPPFITLNFCIRMK